jgi:hypothetical protein
MTTTQRVWSIGVALTLAMAVPAGTVLAQSPTPREQQQAPPPAGRGGARAGGGRANLPAVTPNMTQQQMQAYIDAYALVQAEKELQLTNDQYANFVTRLRKLQDVRRGHQVERRRLLNELAGLLQGQGQGQATEAGKDDAIMAHVKALDDLQQRSATEVSQAYKDLDAVLTPWQRGRYRMFEEQLERRKVELLAKINSGGGSE